MVVVGVVFVGGRHVAEAVCDPVKVVVVAGFTVEVGFGGVDYFPACLA